MRKSSRAIRGSSIVVATVAAAVLLSATPALANSTNCRTGYPQGGQCSTGNLLPHPDHWVRVEALGTIKCSLIDAHNGNQVGFVNGPNGKKTVRGLYGMYYAACTSTNRLLPGIGTIAND